MKKLLPFVAGFVALSALQDLAVAQGGMDMAVIQKWEPAKVVRYRVEGVHKGRVPVVFGDYEGKADVMDRMTVEFSWDVKKRKIIEPVKVTDGKSELTNLKSDGTNCGPPQLKGAYEQFQYASHSMISGDQVQIKGTRVFPPASVSNYPGGCSMRSIPGGKEEVSLFVTGAGPEGLGFPIMPGGPISGTADRKSFLMRTGNWVWTYTPTLVQ